MIFYANPQGDIANALQRAYQETGKQSGKNPQLLMCVLQGRSVLYEEIKRIGDTIIGIPTQASINIGKYSRWNVLATYYTALVYIF